MSGIDRSQFSKHLAFCSRHKYQNKQCGTNLHKPIFRCLPNFPCQEANNSLTLSGIAQCILNKQKTIDHNSYAIGQWRRRWSTDSPHLSHIKHHSSTARCLFQRLSVVKIPLFTTVNSLCFSCFSFLIIFSSYLSKKKKRFYIRQQSKKRTVL